MRRVRLLRAQRTGDRRVVEPAPACRRLVVRQLQVGELCEVGERFPRSSAFFQLARSDAELHLFTAIGNDDAGAFVERAIAETGARLHIARRTEPHTRDLVMIDPSGERAIAVVGEPLHPNADDPLPWELLGELDAVYFTAQDPRLLVHARAARLLTATARRQPSIADSGVCLDAVIGSRADPREASAMADYDPQPIALIMTEGARGGEVVTAAGSSRFEAPRSRSAVERMARAIVLPARSSTTSQTGYNRLLLLLARRATARPYSQGSIRSRTSCRCLVELAASAAASRHAVARTVVCTLWRCPHLPRSRLWHSDCYFRSPRRQPCVPRGLWG